jgi:hypothetical protein
LSVWTLVGMAPGHGTARGSLTSGDINFSNFHF